MGKKAYKLMVTKHVNYEQIVKAESKKEALELFDEELLYELDSKITGAIGIEDFSYEKTH